jgi:heterodisulfide reductase subunit B2
MKYLYYPGCSVKGTAREYEESFQAIAPVLGIEFETVEDWVCCGATVAKSVCKEIADDLPKQAILQAAKTGLDLLMLCPSCHLNHARILREAQRAQGPGKAMEGFSRDRYPGVKQLLEVLAFDLGWGEIKEKISRPLRNVKAVPYYGCLVIRPYSLGGKDSLENPITMEDLIAAAGAEPLSFPYKMECCGGGLLLSKERVALKLGGMILREARKMNPDCIVVSCPLCHFLLDAKQRAIEKETGEKMRLPVLYISQFLGLALGLGPRKLGLHRLITPPSGFLGKF